MQIIKTDELGRVRTSKERREALLEEYERGRIRAMGRDPVYDVCVVGAEAAASEEGRHGRGTSSD